MSSDERYFRKTAGALLTAAIDAYTEGKDCKEAVRRFVEQKTTTEVLGVFSTVRNILEELSHYLNELSREV